MNFSEENNDDNLIDTHHDQIENDGYKKYVVSINNEFVPLIDAMSVERRNELINEIISLHNDEINDKKQMKQGVKVATLTIIALIILLFAAPFVLWLVNKSYTMTRDNYNEMEQNFEVLYRK